LQLAIGVLELEGAGIWKESFRRTITNALLSNGTNVNYTMVKDGWCWWYRKYAPWNTELASLEQHARETKQGLWMGPTHIPPCQWRKRTR
jgi:endonuclease YncB( thermonuclease family)